MHSFCICHVLFSLGVIRKVRHSVIWYGLLLSLASMTLTLLSSSEEEEEQGEGGETVLFN